MMRQVTSIEDVIRAAIQEVLTHPPAFPEVPAGWAARAQDAMDRGDVVALQVLGLELRSTHAQYSADFDRMPSLYELRQALPGPLRDYITAGVPCKHLLRD